MDYSDLSGEPTTAPEAVGVIWNSDSADIFISTGSETELRGRNGLTGFEIAGENGEFVPAKAEFADKAAWHAADGDAIIHVSGVSDPAAVRYLWTNYTEDIPLFDRENGIPLPPFVFTKPQYRGK